ncbi:MAG: hypothetical protein M3N42_03475 [Cyanobacteriota bacterium]|nr:hypothetical protein [Cyanobacteriota bacterium]
MRELLRQQYLTDRAFCSASWQIGSIQPLPRLDSKRYQVIQQRHLSALGVKVFRGGNCGGWDSGILLPLR